jgi:hypothetical protein
MFYTQLTNQPNDWYAYFDGKIVLKAVYQKIGLPLAWREIHITTRYAIFCNGWQNAGGGHIQGSRWSPEVHVEGEGVFEEVIDFLLLPAQIHQFIENEFQSSIGNTTSGSIPIDFGNTPLACTSLGTVSHWPNDKAALQDEIVWDVPPPPPPIIRTLGLSSATKYAP